MITLNVNKFLGALTNLITYVEVADVLKLDTLKLNKICKKNDIKYGDGKVIRSADIPTVANMPTVSTVLTTVSPVVNEEYISLSGFKTIQLTINKFLLRGAFLNEYELGDFTSYLLKTMRASKQAHIFDQLVNLIDTYTPTNAEQTKTITMFNTTGLLDPMQLQMAQTYNTNAFIKELLKVQAKLNTPYNKFNDNSQTEIISNDDMVLVATDELSNDLLVDTFAKLFNSGKITEKFQYGESVVIPSDLLTNLGATFLCYLAHKDKFQYGYAFEVATEFFDPSTLNVNNFLHFAYYIGSVKAYPCIKFEADYTLTPTALQ